MSYLYFLLLGYFFHFLRGKIYTCNVKFTLFQEIIKPGNENITNGLFTNPAAPCMLARNHSCNVMRQIQSISRIYRENDKLFYEIYVHSAKKLLKKY